MRLQGASSGKEGGGRRARLQQARNGKTGGGPRARLQGTRSGKKRGTRDEGRGAGRGKERGGTREEGGGERLDDSAMQGINPTNIQSGLGVIALAPFKRRRQERVDTLTSSRMYPLY